MTEVSYDASISSNGGGALPTTASRPQRTVWVALGLAAAAVALASYLRATRPGALSRGARGYAAVRPVEVEHEAAHEIVHGAFSLEDDDAIDDEQPGAPPALEPVVTTPAEGGRKNELAGEIPAELGASGGQLPQALRAPGRVALDDTDQLQMHRF